MSAVEQFETQMLSYQEAQPDTLRALIQKEGIHLDSLFYEYTLNLVCKLSKVFETAVHTEIDKSQHLYTIKWHIPYTGSTGKLTIEFAHSKPLHDKVGYRVLQPIHIARVFEVINQIDTLIYNLHQSEQVRQILTAYAKQIDHQRKLDAYIDDDAALYLEIEDPGKSQLVLLTMDSF